MIFDSLYLFLFTCLKINNEYTEYNCVSNHSTMIYAQSDHYSNYTVNYISNNVEVYRPIQLF